MRLHNSIAISLSLQKSTTTAHLDPASTDTFHPQHLTQHLSVRPCDVPIAEFSQLLDLNNSTIQSETPDLELPFQVCILFQRSPPTHGPRFSSSALHMSPQAPRKAMSPLFSPIFIDKQQNAGLFRLVGEGISSASPTVLIDQQTAGPSSVVEEAMSAACPAALINQQQTAGPSTAVEDQLRKQIARLEDDIRQLKLDQDPNRKAITHTLLQEKLAQLRKKNLNLRVELQVAQERLRLLEEKQENHHALERKHKRCKKLMQQAIENLSTGLDLPNGESVNLGLNIEAVVPGASLLPPQTGSSPPVDEPVLPPVLSRLVRTLTLPVSLLAAQVEAQLPTMPIFSASLRFIPPSYNLFSSRPVVFKHTIHPHQSLQKQHFPQQPAQLLAFPVYRKSTNQLHGSVTPNNRSSSTTVDTSCCLAPPASPTLNSRASKKQS